MNALSITFRGGRTLSPSGFRTDPLAVAGGQVVAGAGGLALDVPGWLILPGLVDLHGDGFERHLAPRRGAVTDLGRGLRAVDSELAANGITTAVLAQFWSFEGGMRRPDFANRLVDALAQARPALATDMRLQLRLETHLIDDYADAEALIARAKIGYVVFNDHLPHDALAAGKRPPRLTGQALKSRRSPEAHLALLHQLHARAPEVPQALAALAARLRARGVILGSHDDTTPDTRAFFRGIGAAIAEFPETHAAAAAARSAGDTIILGAPNVMRGGSHKGNADARDLIKAGLCDALVSDYHYPSLLQAVLKLAPPGDEAALAALWPMVSRAPARLLGLNDRGTLQTGARADLILLDPASGHVMGTMVAGRFSYVAPELVSRLWTMTGTMTGALATPGHPAPAA